MVEALQNCDTAVFHFINRSLQNPVFDVFMPFVTDLNKHLFVLALVGVGLTVLAVKGGKNARIAVAALIVGIVFSDQLNSSFAKFILERQRPCHVLQNVHLLVGCGSGYSFPSSHAVNNFCGAIILSFFFRRAVVWLFSFAIVVSFSRVYVGVHYPSDVVGGAVIGICCGLFVIALFLWAESLILRFTAQERELHSDKK